MYLDAGQLATTPYYYKGIKLEPSVLIITMQDLHTAFRQEIQEFTSHQKDTLELAQFTEGLQLMDRVGRDYMRRFMSYGGMSYGESTCSRCGHEPGSIGARHGAKGGMQIECPHKQSQCGFCKKVFALVPDIGTKMIGEDGSELHPTGYHTKSTCPYM